MGDDVFVLDTSALMSFIEDEAGSDRVEQVLREKQVYLPWLVLLEIAYITHQERGEDESHRRYALIKQLPITILWGVDEPILLSASRLKALFHLSLADAIIAGCTINLHATLIHKDPEFEALTGQISLEALPYKKEA